MHKRKMRDLVSCLSENAVNVSHSSCSSYSKNACISPSLSPSIQNSISCVYKLVLSTLKQFLITVTWCNNKSNSNQGLSIRFGDDDPSAAAPFRLNTNSRFFRNSKKKGSKLLDSDESKIEVLWDLSNAKYDSGPEPVNGFYVVILVDSEIGLILGDMAEEAVSKRFKTSTPMAKVSLLSRREHCSGNTLYTTKAQFCDTGTWHDVLIRCSVENEGFKVPVLSVCIDKKTVIRVKRLQWNFRGNQTIFVDGLVVDLLWDVHDWFFNPASGNAVFMFRTRSGLDSRLWLEEKAAQKDKDKVQFSLLIYACKSS
ncbi:uncharacterized protein LOC133299622 [Gastrolobium bilobum]|uniref:uncharacterized protein LOC133299622 n=1 Tax=Gastrolobium bilobum TaxID=150636 RepID=UPI002AB1649E|nr:uncharacterized protein LOC133299622 [Gastrolobium bilobum]